MKTKANHRRVNASGLRNADFLRAVGPVPSPGLGHERKMHFSKDFFSFVTEWRGFVAAIHSRGTLCPRPRRKTDRDRQFETMMALKPALTGASGENRDANQEQEGQAHSKPNSPFPPLSPVKFCPTMKTKTKPIRGNPNQVEAIRAKSDQKVVQTRTTHHGPRFPPLQNSITPTLRTYDTTQIPTIH